MNRKEILGYQVIRMTDEKNVGILKELIIGKKAFKVEWLISYHPEKNFFYKIPFSLITSIDNGIIWISDAIDISVESKNEALLEIKKCQLVFQDKEVFDEEQNSIGKIVDYGFDDRSGALQSVIYYHFKEKRKEVIMAEHILKNTLNSITISQNKSEPKKVPQKESKIETRIESNEEPKIESPKEPRIQTPTKPQIKMDIKENLELRIKEVLKKQEEKHQKEMAELHRFYQKEKEKYAVDVEKEREAIQKNLESIKAESDRLKLVAQQQQQEQQLLEGKKDYYQEIEAVVSGFKLKVLHQQEKLLALYHQKEKEILTEMEEIQVQLLQKKEAFLLTVTKGKEQQMLEDLTTDYEGVLREIKQLQRQFKMQEEERIAHLDHEYEQIKIREIENQKKEIELSVDMALEDILKEAEQTLSDISTYTSFGTEKDNEMVDDSEVYNMEQLYEMQKERDQIIQNIKTNGDK